jgi:hypothetical protein
VFCNTYQLRAGQYLLFYRDNLKRLVGAHSDICSNLMLHLQRSITTLNAICCLAPPAVCAVAVSLCFSQQ